MGIFSRKFQVGIEDFCQSYYDSVINPQWTEITNQWEEPFQLITSVDQSFINVDLPTFRREMLAVHLELFGLAWTHRLKRDHYLMPQVVFTKLYLDQNEQPSAWERMKEYNTIIGHSGTEIYHTERIKRAAISSSNKLKWSKWTKWVSDAKAEFGEERARVVADYAARVVSRLVTDVAWSKGVTCQMLIGTLCGRLGCELNESARSRLGDLMVMFYTSAKKSIEAVKIEA
jgi:hypothetical protein